jgi:putative SOS response-associated peptidase YedK
MCLQGGGKGSDGLVAWWPGGAVARTFTIVTIEGNTTMTDLHDRMPVILDPNDWPTSLGKVRTIPGRS